MDSGARFVALSHQSSPWVEAQLALVEVVCPASARILEVGSGSGELASRLTANGYEVVALEPDPAMFEVLLERRRAITSQLHPLTPLPIPFQSFMPSLQFDAVLAMGVFSFLTPREQ